MKKHYTPIGISLIILLLFFALDSTSFRISDLWFSVLIFFIGVSCVYFIKEEVKSYRKNNKYKLADRAIFISGIIFCYCTEQLIRTVMNLCTTQ